MTAPSEDLAERAASLAWSTARALRAGELGKARSRCEEALRLTEDAGQLHAAASVRTTLGRVLLALGDLEGARTCLADALAVHRLQGDTRIGALTRRQLAECVLEQGDLDAAMALLVEAATVFARLGEAAFEADAQLAIAAVHHAGGRLPEAERHVQVALSAAQPSRDDHLLGDAFTRMAALHREAGRPQRADRELQRARQAYEHVGARLDVLRVDLARLRVQVEHGRLDLERAFTLARELDTLESPWLRGRAWSTVGVAGDSSGAVQTFQLADALLSDHPTRACLVALDRGFVDLSHGDRGAAIDRLGRVPEGALRSVEVRLALRGLRSALTRRR